MEAYLQQGSLLILMSNNSIANGGEHCVRASGRGRGRLIHRCQAITPSERRIILCLVRGQETDLIGPPTERLRGVVGCRKKSGRAHT